MDHVVTTEDTLIHPHRLRPNLEREAGKKCFEIILRRSFECLAEGLVLHYGAYVFVFRVLLFLLRAEVI